MLDNDSEYSETEEDTPLYENCTYIGGCYPEIYAYTPQHALDENLFRELISNKRLIHPHIIISNEMHDHGFPEQFSVGNICVSNSDKHPKCCFCKLSLPVDLTYYTWTEKEKETNKNACYVCYLEHANQLTTLPVTQTIIESGMENVTDWIHIYTHVPPCHPYSENFNDYSVYCNLYPNSTYYGRFAVSSYAYMCGDEFDIVPELSIDSILDKRCPTSL